MNSDFAISLDYMRESHMQFSHMRPAAYVHAEGRHDSRKFRFANFQGNFMPNRLKMLCTTAFVILSAIGASASAAVFTSQAAFEVANPGLTFTDFSGFPFSATPLPSPYVNSGVTFTGPAIAAINGEDGDSIPAIISNQGNGNLTATFSPSSAVGLLLSQGFGAQFGGTTGPISVTAYHGSTVVYSGTPTVGNFDAFSFFGISGFGPITSVNLATSGASGFQFPGIGLVAYASSAVPEPATWAMTLAGFGLVGAVLRRRTIAAPINFARL